ncbi:phage terminase large subunit [soil metagenome]
MSNNQILDALYRDDIVAFAERAMIVLEPDTQLKIRWHHRAIGYQLKETFHGNIRRLVINQPPKTLKTHLVSVSFAAWLLAHDPSLKIGIISYDDALARKIVRSIRQIMRDPWYRNLAPNTHIKVDKDTEAEFETTAGGGVMARTVHGAVTGQGYDFIVIDDPIKASSAYSETERRSVEDAYSSAIANRWRNPAKGVLVVVMQRVHVDDFTAFLLRTIKDIMHLSIPAIATTTQYFDINDEWAHTFAAGELLEPERLSTEVLDELRALQGSANFEAQYLQDPQASAGRIIKPDWLRRYEKIRKPDFTVVSIDPAFTKDGGDYSAAIVANIIHNDVEIIHAEQGQFDYPGLLTWIKKLDLSWKPDTILIETMGAGTGLKYYLDVNGIKHLSFVITHEGKSKIERMEMVSPQIEAGRLWLPQAAQWLDSFSRALTEFPYGMSDDWPDALSQLFLYLPKVRQWANYYRNARFPPSVPDSPQERRKSMYYQRYELTW